MIRALLVTALLTGTGTLAARPEPAAAARRELAEGDFEKAIKLTEKELKRKPAAGIAAQLHLVAGQAHAALQKPDRARDSFRSALELDPEISLDAEATPPDQLELFEAARRTVQGELQLLTNRDGATVRIDGKPYGPTPLTLRLPVGRHEVEVTAGAQRKVEEVVVSAAEARTLRVELPADAPVATATTLPKEGGTRTSGGPGSSVTDVGATAPGEARGSVVPGVAMIVGGLALAGGGAYGTMYALGIKNDFDAQQLPGAVPTVTREDAQRAQLVFPASIGASTVGVGLVVSGVVALLTRGGGEVQSASLDVVTSGEGGALVLSGRF